MKKIILYLFIILTSFITCDVLGQSMVVHQGWKCENEGNWNSFYWKVKRSVNTDEVGYYHYDVYFYSNSYLNSDVDFDGKYDKAIVYVTNLTVTMNEYKNAYLYNAFSVVIPYALVDWSDKKVAYFYSYSPTCKFLINYEDATPYNYSNIPK